MVFFLKSKNQSTLGKNVFFLGWRDGRGDFLQKRNLKIEDIAILEVFYCPK
jgi:hypothetical protein